MSAAERFLDALGTTVPRPKNIEDIFSIVARWVGPQSIMILVAPGPHRGGVLFVLPWCWSRNCVGIATPLLSHAKPSLHPRTPKPLGCRWGGGVCTGTPMPFRSQGDTTSPVDCPKSFAPLQMSTSTVNPWTRHSPMVQECRPPLVMNRLLPFSKTAQRPPLCWPRNAAASAWTSPKTPLMCPRPPSS